ncbi:MAG: AAA family ATPase [Chloroflexota bacterium]|nr:AAA family ATPase [Chloroflexota bacterium]
MTPPLPELVQALLDPAAYPEPPPQIELVQTQMSFVFLAGDYVYKVKKPVNLGYLDYTTLAKRELYCRREVELNRRLCAEAYLDVVPITRERGRILIGGRGKTIECAVKMRRLPQEKMLNVLLGKDQATSEMLGRVAEKLAGFHREAETSPAISKFGDLATITQNIEENFSQTEQYVGRTVSLQKYLRIKEYTHSFIKRNTVLFRQRVAEGRIRDCHGDLHAAHICFADGLCIYDCIEFNDRFRYCDVASEVAFLAMDLDHYGRADLSRSFIKAYVAKSQDKPLLELLNFYKCYRAYVRGKVEGFKLDDPYIIEKESVRQVASSYFDLAHSYLRSRPLLLITVGLVGTGKSVVAQALAKRLGLVVISSDVTRKQLANVPLTEHRFEGFDRGIYTTGFTRLTYDTMFSEAKDVLREDGVVIMDASFIKAAERQKAKKLADEMKTDFFVVECQLDERTIRQRLAQRLSEGSVSDGRWEILEPQKKEFAPVVEISPPNHVIINTSKPVEENVRHVMERIGEG